MLRFVALLIAVFVPLTAWGQGFVIDVPGGREVPLAVDKPATPSGDPKGQAMVMWETLNKDLEMSGYFTVLDPKGFIDNSGGVEPGSFKMADWTLLKTSVLVKTRFLAAGDASCDPAGTKVCGDAFVYYVVNGDLLLKQRFRSSGSGARAIAHEIANEVLRSVTGNPGFFGTPIAAVGKQGGNKELYVLGLDGKNARSVTRNGSINLSPSWSADGTRVAWTSYKKANPDLYIKNLRTGDTQVLSNLAGINTSPAWHPSGDRIAMARSHNGDSDIYILSTRSGEVLERVTKGGGIDVSPAWSTDGTLLAFASERSGGSQIYVKNYTSGQTQRVTYVGDFNSDPAISPDGTKLAFVSRSQGGFDVYVSDLNGRNAIRITQDMGDNEDPSWSPDGRYLLFSSTRTGRGEIWLSTSDGRSQVQVTRTGGWSQPTFGPPGN